MLGGGNGDSVSGRLKCSHNSHIGAWHNELAVLNSKYRVRDTSSGIVSVVQLIDFIAWVGGNGHIHLCAIGGCSGSANGAMLGGGNGDSVSGRLKCSRNSHIATRHSELAVLNRNRLATIDCVSKRLKLISFFRSNTHSHLRAIGC